MSSSEEYNMNEKSRASTSVTGPMRNGKRDWHYTPLMTGIKVYATSSIPLMLRAD